MSLGKRINFDDIATMPVAIYYANRTVQANGSILPSPTFKRLLNKCYVWKLSFNLQYRNQAPTDTSSHRLLTQDTIADIDIGDLVYFQGGDGNNQWYEIANMDHHEFMSVWSLDLNHVEDVELFTYKPMRSISTTFALSDAFRSAMDAVADDLQEYTRLNHRFQNRTGNLQASIVSRAESGLGEITLELSAGMFYAGYVEDQMPYLQPAQEWLRENFVQLLKSHL